MKKFVYFLFTITFLCGCAQDFQTEKIPFTFTPQRRLMSVPVSIQGVKGNLLFDTGSGPFLALDTTYAKRIEPFDSIERQGEGLTSGGFADFNSKDEKCYQGLLEVYIGSHRFEERHFSVADYRKIFEISEFDGMFALPVPSRDSLSVWQLNFEDNYISFINADSFKVEDNYLELPLIWDESKKIHTELPLEIYTKQGKVIKEKQRFLIDTGSIADVMFIKDTDEAKALDEYKDHAYWLYNRHFWDAKIEVCDKVELDSARVYVYNLPVVMPYKRIIDLNFLKHFNVYFDLKNEKMYLQPISKFERITQGKKAWGKLYLENRGNKTFIGSIAEYKNNDAIKNGFRVGDEVLSINGIKDIANISLEQLEKLRKEEVWNYVVKRGDKILHLKLNRNLENQIDD